jgi:hypothetical protein
MPRAGRPEQPLVTDGPVSQLAGELRRMRERAGLTYGQLAAKTGLSAATLRAAAAGVRRPTRRVTSAFVGACSGDQDMAWALWAAACRAAGREPPGQPPADPPDPAGAAGAADLVGVLKLLLQWADSPSLAELNRRAGGHNLLPPSTVSDMLHSQRLPPLERMLTFVRACGLEEDQAAAWRAAWERIKARQSAPPPAASQPSGATAPRLVSYWEPTLTPKEAAAVGISRRKYESAALFARMAAEEHQHLGTPRRRWEPTLILNCHLAAPFIADGEKELASRLEKEVDPVLDKARGLLENVKANLGEIAQAMNRVGQYDETIERHGAAGMHHHRRARVLLQQLAAWAPWVEMAGFLTFITYYLNVPLLQPWRNWLGWSFAVEVVAIILGQTWLVGHAARSHNHAREDRVDGHRYAAQLEFTRRNWYLWLTAVTAMAITAGMVWRGTAALGSASVGTAAVMVFAAAVTGLLLPTLAYLGFALDGSRVSRERDGLAADLADELRAYLKTIGDSRCDLVVATAIGDKLRNTTIPDICHTTQEAVDAVYEFYGTVRLLIGGLSADPPPKITTTISRDADSNGGYIGTSIPGAGSVNLHPLLTRQRQLAEIETQRTDLLEQIDALPPPLHGGARAIPEAGP